MSAEYRNNKVGQVRECVPDVTTQDCLQALQVCGWEVPSTVRHVKIEKLFRQVLKVFNCSFYINDAATFTFEMILNLYLWLMIVFVLGWVLPHAINASQLCKEQIGMLS